MYEQGPPYPAETTTPRDSLQELRPDFDRETAEWDWVYIALRDEPDGPWTEVAFAGGHPTLPDAYDLIAAQETT